MSQLLLAAFFFLGLGTGKTFAQVCGENLEGYNVSTLAQQNPWVISVEPTECIPLSGGTIRDCKVEFAICHDLASEYCNGDSIAVCMSILTENPEEDAFIIGTSTSVVEAPNPSDTVEGFSYNFSNGDSFPNCNTSAQIMMVFQCDKSAVWNPKNNNVTEFVYFDWVDGTCMFTAYFNYSGACLKETPVEPYVCELPGYDVKTLSNVSHWTAYPSPNNCYFPGDLEPVDGSCILDFSFCQSLTVGTCKDSVFCETVVANPIVFYSFGAYSPDITIEETGENAGGFSLQYDGGSQTNNCSEGLLGIVTFVCDKDADWQQLNDTNVTKYMTATADVDHCEYVVVFRYSGACRTSSTSSTSIVGWILMAIVIGIALIYLVAGLIVQYVRGKRGIYLIPNVDFWKLFLVLVLEGCRFSLDVVTCYQLRSMPHVMTKQDYESL